MNGFAPYAAFIIRLAVGGVFLRHGITKLHHGIPAVAGFLHAVPVPFAPVWAVVITAVETVGAACVLLGIFTRFWAACMAVEMVVAILAVKFPERGNIELEGLLLAGAIALVALGDGPLSAAIGLKRRA
jgi:putative oxidoreductase